MQNNNINQKIRANTVLLIDENGNNIGSISFREALNKAQLAGLDLVEVSSGSKGVPVCRIMDFGKWKYEQSKRARKNKIQHQRQEIKELKFRPTTGDNDLQYRAKQAEQFLERGDKVRLVVRFKGREQEHMFNTGKVLLEKFLNLMTTTYVIDANPNVEGSSIVMILAAEKK